ncbi:hypothetical protein AGMMS50218_04050 [Actinomycetota bacterium]|nr:hypothetical protein AGMMS50218_04050 [Actinomycetota bacterium]
MPDSASIWDWSAPAASASASAPARAWALLSSCDTGCGSLEQAAHATATSTIADHRIPLRIIARSPFCPQPPDGTGLRQCREPGADVDQEPEWLCATRLETVGDCATSAP